MFTFTRSCWGMSCMISFCGHWSVFLKKKKKEGEKTLLHSLCASLPFILHYANLGQTGVTHRFSPWLTWTWQGRERVSFVLESMEEALGFCGDWWRQRERWQGEGKKERRNKMKRLTYRVKRPCWQRWMIGLKAGGLGEINNLCVQLPQQERSHWRRNSCYDIMSIKTVFPPRKHAWWNLIFQGFVYTDLLTQVTQQLVDFENSTSFAHPTVSLQKDSVDKMQDSSADRQSGAELLLI